MGEGGRPAAADLLSSLLSYERWGGDTQQWTCLIVFPRLDRAQLGNDHGAAPAGRRERSPSSRSRAAQVDDLGDDHGAAPMGAAKGSIERSELSRHRAGITSMAWRIKDDSRRMRPLKECRARVDAIVATAEVARCWCGAIPSPIALA